MSCIDHGQKGNEHGYGTTGFEGQSRRYHRVVYCKSKGINWKEIIGFCIRHTCDNPRCINPDHLLIGTLKDNMQDMISRGRNNPLIGEKNPKAKLNEKYVVEIRDLYFYEIFNQVKLAKLYEVSQAVVNDVILNKRWKHVKGHYMARKISHAMEKAKQLVLAEGFTPAAAAREMGLSANAVYQSSWYRELLASKELKAAQK